MPATIEHLREDWAKFDAARLGKLYPHVSDPVTGARLENVRATSSPHPTRGMAGYVSADIHVGGQKVGSLSRIYYPDTNTVVRERTSVDEAHQGRGIATGLHAAEEQGLRSAGVSAIESVPITDAGKRLTARQGGFEPTDLPGRVRKLLEARQAQRFRVYIHGSNRHVFATHDPKEVVSWLADMRRGRHAHRRIPSHSDAYVEHKHPEVGWTGLSGRERRSLNAAVAKRLAEHQREARIDEAFFAGAAEYLLEVMLSPAQHAERVLAARSRHRILHQPGSWGRGMLYEDGTVHTWPEAAALHSEYAKAARTPAGWLSPKATRSRALNRSDDKATQREVMAHGARMREIGQMPSHGWADAHLNISPTGEVTRIGSTAVDATLTQLVREHQQSILREAGRGRRVGQALSAPEREERVNAARKRWEGHAKSVPAPSTRVPGAQTVKAARGAKASVTSMGQLDPEMRQAVMHQIALMPDRHLNAMDPGDRAALQAQVAHHVGKRRAARASTVGRLGARLSAMAHREDRGRPTPEVSAKTDGGKRSGWLQGDIDEGSIKSLGGDTTNAVYEATIGGKKVIVKPLHGMRTNGYGNLTQGQDLDRELVAPEIADALGNEGFARTAIREIPGHGLAGVQEFVAPGGENAGDDYVDKTSPRDQMVQLAEMGLYDAVTGNMDRHLNNIKIAPYKDADGKTHVDAYPIDQGCILPNKPGGSVKKGQTMAVDAQQGRDLEDFEVERLKKLQKNTKLLNKVEQRVPGAADPMRQRIQMLLDYGHYPSWSDTFLDEKTGKPRAPRDDELTMEKFLAVSKEPPAAKAAEKAAPKPKATPKPKAARKPKAKPEAAPEATPTPPAAPAPAPAPTAPPVPTPAVPTAASSSARTPGGDLSWRQIAQMSPEERTAELNARRAARGQVKDPKTGKWVKAPRKPRAPRARRAKGLVKDKATGKWVQARRTNATAAG